MHAWLVIVGYLQLLEAINDGGGNDRAAIADGGNNGGGAPRICNEWGAAAFQASKSR